jgi:ribosome-binding factor A
MDRVNELIHSLLAETVNQQVHLPGAMITIIEVTTHSDLKSAQVLFSVLPDKFYGQALTALRKATPALRRSITTKLKMKFTPRLVWKIDTRPKRADSLEELFRQISEEPL